MRSLANLPVIVELLGCLHDLPGRHGGENGIKREIERIMNHGYKRTELRPIKLRGLVESCDRQGLPTDD